MESLRNDLCCLCIFYTKIITFFSHVMNGIGTLSLKYYVGSERKKKAKMMRVFNISYHLCEIEKEAANFCHFDFSFSVNITEHFDFDFQWFTHT